MFKKLCVVFLSVCIAATMVLGMHTLCSSNNDQDNVILCDLDAKEELF